MLPTAGVSVMCAVLALAGASPAARQFSPPPGWKWVTDSDARLVSSLDPPEGAWLFGTMAPGWHITTGGVILFEPSYSARGRFVVNGEKLAEVPRSGALFDGVVGLRVGAQLNLHVTNLDLTHRLALPRAPK